MKRFFYHDAGNVIETHEQVLPPIADDLSAPCAF
jgi:hypothetical protein